LGTDGNLVVNAAGHSIWATKSAGTQGSYFAAVQGDGNFVVYRRTGGSTVRAVWSSDTAGHPGLFLQIGCDGTIGLTANGATFAWGTGTTGSVTVSDRLFAPASIAPGQEIFSGNGDWVLYNDGSYQLGLWQRTGGGFQLRWAQPFDGPGTSWYVQFNPDGMLIACPSGYFEGQIWPCTWHTRGGLPTSDQLSLWVRNDGTFGPWSNWGVALGWSIRG
jgi:hypothetical protein